MRLGVFLPNWIGDVVMATPALRMLRTLAGDQGQLVGIMRPYVADVLEGTNWFDMQVLYDKPRHRFQLVSDEALRKLRAARLQQVVLLTNSLRTAWMAWRSGARERIGYVGQARSWLLTTRLHQPPKQTTIDGYLMLAQAASNILKPTTTTPSRPASHKPASRFHHDTSELLPSRADDRRLELATTPADEQAADAVWRQLRLPHGDHVAIFNPGGAFGEAKHWPPEHFAELARRLVEQHDLSVLVNCGPAERDAARHIVARAGSSRVVSLAEFEKLPIGLSKACIRRARLLVTTDSGPRFFAIAFNRPVVTLFGPTDPAATATDYQYETCLWLSLDCQPCMQRTCPLGHLRCMRDLSVDQVFAEVTRRLEAAPNKNAA